MDDLATLQTRRDEASAALHQLHMGKSVKDVWRDGRRIKYDGPTDPLKLQAYIDRLDAQIVALTGDPASSGFRRGVMRPSFVRG